jgi:hypothetical protein
MEIDPNPKSDGHWALGTGHWALTLTVTVTVKTQPSLKLKFQRVGFHINRENLKSNQTGELERRTTFSPSHMNR